MSDLLLPTYLTKRRAYLRARPKQTEHEQRRYETEEHTYIKTCPGQIQAVTFPGLTQTGESPTWICPGQVFMWTSLPTGSRSKFVCDLEGFGHCRGGLGGWRQWHGSRVGKLRSAVRSACDPSAIQCLNVRSRVCQGQFRVEGGVEPPRSCETTSPLYNINRCQRLKTA